ncbi:MAG: hypothetical protein NTV39_02695 [Candidatus Saccharibacteria bacterium]|nr:hypothetical protein [Candidatus Saccharibacteria bacterium]
MPRKNRINKHQPLQLEKLVCNKKRYDSDREAQKAAETQMLENMNLELSVYRCDTCRYWHLTRKK